MAAWEVTAMKSLTTFMDLIAKTVETIIAETFLLRNVEKSVACATFNLFLHLFSHQIQSMILPLVKCTCPFEPFQDSNFPNETFIC